MNFTTFLLLAFAFVGVAVASVPRTLDDEHRMFGDFVQTYGRKYTDAEKLSRFECFRKNLVLIDQRNAAGRGIEQHGVNQFTDLCPKEFEAQYLSHRVSNDTHRAMPTGDTPNIACSSIDWRTKGAVTPVINSGACGSCWAISTVDNVEGILAAAGFPLVPLSIQELVDCSTNGGNDGCMGGNLVPAYQWIIQNGGINSAANYPYKGEIGTCNTQKEKHIVAKIGGYVNITSTETAMANYVCEHGPINVALYADSWQTYTGGVLTTCASPYVDFSAAIVGLDLTANPPYWIVKNSWGASWGEQGYIRIAYGNNLCGINQEPSSALPPQ